MTTERGRGSGGGEIAMAKAPFWWQPFRDKAGEAGGLSPCRRWG